MKDTLKRFFKVAEKEEEMNKEDTSEAMQDVVEAVVNEELTTLKKSFEAQTEQLTAALENLAKAQEQLQAIEAVKAQAEAEAKKAKMQSRLDSVVDIIGTEKAESIIGATESLDDSAFAAVASALKVGTEKEANSEMFKEVGVAADVAASVVGESLEIKKIKAKYGKAAVK